MPDPTWEEALFVDRAAPDPDAPVTPFVALQRVVIRMLFDRGFVDRVYADPSRALAGLDLDPRLVDQVLANDRRLWNADRLRRTRALKILLDEFKVTSTLVLRETRRIAFLDAFFSSSAFHDAVAKRGYMALAFVAYLERAIAGGVLKSREVAAALAMESEMARSRRELRDARRGRDPALRPVEPGRPGRRWVVRAGVRAAMLAGGTIALVQQIEKLLFELSQVPAFALCDDAPAPDPLPDLRESSPLGYLFEPEPRGKVELSEIPAAYARVVRACARPVSEAELARMLEPDGVGPAEAADLAGELLAAGVLRGVEIDHHGGVSERGSRATRSAGAGESRKD
jgi:hypothetical protein